MSAAYWMHWQPSQKERYRYKLSSDFLQSSRFSASGHTFYRDGNKTGNIRTRSIGKSREYKEEQRKSWKGKQ